MRRQFVADEIGIGQLADRAHAMDEHDFVEALIDLGVADQAEERRQTGAGRQHIEILSLLQVAHHQCADRLAPDQQRVVRPHMLQP